MTSFKNASWTARRKHAAFKTRFGELLFTHDFQFCKGRFLRFHRGEIMLSVGLDIARDGSADIRFGAMPLCAQNADPALCFGETAASFGKSCGVDSDFHTPDFESGFERQLSLFQSRLLEPFAAVDSVSTLLNYQERILEDKLRAMPMDWAFWECVHLCDYDRAHRYAQVWRQLLESEAAAHQRRCRDEILSADLTMRSRRIRQRSLSYRCKRLKHFLYQAQRTSHLLDVGAYALLRENVQRHIAASSAAFFRLYPDYKKE